MERAESTLPPVMPKVAEAQIRYSRAAMVLHWIVAAAIIAEIGLGLRMEGAGASERFAIFQLHKSIGVTILLLSLVRAGVRWTRPAPVWPDHLGRWERFAAGATHIGFYGLMLALPLTGWLAVSSSRIAIPTLLYGTVPWPHIPGVSALAPTIRASVNAASTISHKVLVWTMLLLLALHVAGALKHQFVDGKADMGRMLPAPRRFLSGATLVTLAALAGVFLIAYRLYGPGGANSSVSHVVAAAPPLTPISPTAVETAPAQPATGTLETDEAQSTKPRQWLVRRSGANLGFRAAWSQQPVTGTFARWDADIRFDPDALDQSQVRVSVDLASVKTDNADADSALPGDDFFAVTQFPRAVFLSTRFKSLGGDRYQIYGTLSLHGVSKAINFPFTLKIKGDAAQMQAAFDLDRTLFGVGQGQWADTQALPASIALTIRLAADAAPKNSSKE